MDKELEEESQFCDECLKHSKMCPVQPSKDTMKFKSPLASKLFILLARIFT